ncbi:MAG: SDR family oxidoreductase [Pseudomonadota bacterium]
MRLDQQRLVITGAAGGIGRATARRAVAEGAQVLLTDREAEPLERVCVELGEAAQWLAGDLLEPAFCDSLAEQAASRLNGLDGVINNAGIITRGNVLATRDADWRASFAINVDAVFRICRSAIAWLTTQRQAGVIVNVASCWGLYPGPDHLAYCTTKAAVAAMTRCLGRDHAPDRIRVNAVAPNEVDTPMLRSGFEIRGLNVDTAVSELDASVPLGRIATPDDIADVIVFLCSDQSRYVCGSVIEVNGAKPVG